MPYYLHTILNCVHTVTKKLCKNVKPLRLALLHNKQKFISYRQGLSQNEASAVNVEKLVNEHEHQARIGSTSTQVSVDATCQTNEDNAQCSYNQRQLFAASNLKLRNDAIILLDEHCLNHKQIVVERHDGVNQRNEHKHIDGNAAGVACTHKDEELAEEACKRWNTGKREHGKHHSK